MAHRAERLIGELPAKNQQCQHINTPRQTLTLPAPHSLQVNGRVPSASVQGTAQHLSRGNASLAIELVGYDTELKTAMQYVFGSSFICQV